MTAPGSQRAGVGSGAGRGIAAAAGFADAGGPSANWFLALPAALLVLFTLALAGQERPFTFVDWINLPFHEAGHLLFRPFGRTLHLLGGTLLQLLVPLALAGYFLARRRSPYAALLCLWWFGENFLNVSVYMADARDLRLDLVGGGEHDWNSLFYDFGLLTEESVRTIARATRGAGVLIMLASAAVAGGLALRPRRRAALETWLADRLDGLGVHAD